MECDSGVPSELVRFCEEQRRKKLDDRKLILSGHISFAQKDLHESLR